MEQLEIYTGSYGFFITVDSKLDLSAATNVVLKIKNPRGLLFDHPLTENNFENPSVSGVIRYKAAASDFTQPGTYSLQVFDLTGGDKKFASPIVKIKVKPSVEYIEP